MLRPRLLYLVHQYGELTGVSLHTEMLVRELAETYEISVAWPVSEIPGHPGLWGLRFRPANGDERIIVTAPPSWPVTAFREPTVEAALQEILNWSAPDIIHIQHFLNWPLGTLDRAVESGAKVVVSFHDHYVLSPQYALAGFETHDEVITPEYSRRVFGRDLSRHLVERREFLRRSLERVSVRVAVSPYIEAKLQAVFPGEYRQIEYGIRPFQPLSRRPSARLRFGYLGQRVPMKGWDVLVRAFARVHDRFPDTELHCFCNAPDDGAAPNGVTFHGAYQPPDIASICQQFDIGVVPSVFAETYCMVLSELWLGGVPVIASEIGALRDRVVDGLNGWKFPAGDVAALADRMEWFATHDEWRDWSLPSPRLVDAMVAEYDELYRELSSASSRSEKLPSASGLPVGAADAVDAQTAPLLIVQTCEFADIGDAVHRMQAPSRAVAELPGISMVDCDIYHRRLSELAEQADVLIVHGLDAELLPLIEQRRAAGQVTVFEANDLVDDVHAWNPISHVARDRSLRDIYQSFLEVADGIQTTTPELARRLRDRTDRPIGIFPNQLALLPNLRQAVAEPTRLTIGWAGSPGHFAD